MMNSGGTPLYHFDAHNLHRALGRTASTVFLGVLMTLSTLVIPAFAQQSTEPQQPPSTSDRDRTAAADNSVLTRGTIVSLNAGTMIVRTDGGAHLVFVRDRDTTSPETLRVGSRVRVISRRNSEGIHLARTVVLDGDGAAAAATPTDEPVPSDVRRIEAQIERQARRFRLGVKAGVGLDPEVLMVGAHSKVGPFFHRDVWFRPNIEVGYGEVTTFGALNLEVVYRLPFTERQDRWSVYVGAGPGLNFVNRNFEEAEAGKREIDFNDFDFDGSLNFLTGVESRGGMFLEFKSTTYSAPSVKIAIGYNF